ncbi:MAG: hypothetical protein IJX89_02430 [Alphaproteobacteria bacterium]|nr:hypothetical protein [Alphaproteobacteria bacterium]
MKNIIILLLLTILCLMYPPNGQASDTIKIGPSGACIVDNTLNYQRFYYCGKQETGCANETHNKNDLYGHLDGNESTQEFFFTHNQKIITVSGQTYWCCNGTTNTMGKIQSNACASVDSPPNNIIIEDTTPDKSLALDILNLAINTITKDINTVHSKPTAANSANLPFCDTSHIRNGIHPTEKYCIKCPIGKYFNKEDIQNRYCSTAFALTQSDMMYGYRHTKHSNPHIRNQCWTIKNPDKYKLCIMNSLKQTAPKPQTSALTTINQAVKSQ